MESSIFGRSRLELPILQYRFRNGQKRVLVLGGAHGDEPEGVIAALKLIETWSLQFELKLDVTIVPMFNVDGVMKSSRTNADGVDLNRNLPTKDWSPEIATPRYHPGPKPLSEPENRALVDFIAHEKPQFILSLHSWKPLLNTNGDCGREAAAISKITGYEITPTIGYSTPGCLGTFAGLEREIPTLTYEIERGLDAREICNLHVKAIIAGLKATEH